MWRRVLFPGGGVAALQTVMIAHADNGQPTKFKPSQLPLYGEPAEPEVDIIPEKAGILRENMSVVRKAVWDYMDSIKETTDKVRDKFDVAKAHSSDALHYIQEDSGVLPRAAIITVAGLGGIVAGYRGGAVRKAFFAGVGMTGAASICYPHQAVDIASGQWDNVRQEAKKKWREYYPEEPKQPVKVSTPSKKPEPAKPAEPSMKLADQSSKDKTASVNKISVAETKKDYGQSKPEDKDLYTTRGS